MDIKIKTDTTVVFSLSESEVLKLLTYIDYSRLIVDDVSDTRTYGNLELDNFIYKFSKDINLALEDKLVD